MYTPNYPATVAEILRDDIKFHPKTLAAIARFKVSRPYKGTVRERAEKVFALYTELADVYKIPVPSLQISAIPNDPFCWYRRDIHRIQLNDKMSIVTALHEFGHAIGKDERQTCMWSINLFRMFFPKQYAKLEPKGHQLFRKTTP